MKKCISLPNDVAVPKHLSAFITRKLREIVPMEQIHGWLTEKEAECLKRYAKEKVCLEIGAFEGKSTVAMAQVAKKVYSVDPFSANDAGVAQENHRTTLISYLYNTSPFTNIVAMIGYSYDVLPLLKMRNIEMVFVDGNHSFDACLKDLAMCSGVPYILCHDWKEDGFEVDKAVQFFCENHHYVIEMEIDHLVVLRSPYI